MVMTNTIEKVAREISAQENCDICKPDYVCSLCETTARAALAAIMEDMREPSKAMLNAYYDKHPEFDLYVHDKLEALTRWQAMLSEYEKGALE
jgi:NAD(P)H-flavin reductase